MSPDGSSETPSEHYYQGDYPICILTIPVRVWHVENPPENNASLFLFENICKERCIPSAQPKLSRLREKLRGYREQHPPGKGRQDRGKQGRVHHLLSVRPVFNGALSRAATVTSASEQKPLTQFNQGSALTVAVLGDAIVNSEIKHGGGKSGISEGTSNSLRWKGWETALIN